MFDIGFTEMMIIAVVALVVLGPERLPKVARQAGEWMGKLRRYVEDVKSDINRQMELDELRKLQSQVKDAAQSLKSSVEGAVNDAKTEFSELSTAFEGAASTSSSTEPQTNWDRIYAVRRARERIKDRRVERSKELGLKRPKRAYPRFTQPAIKNEPLLLPDQPVEAEPAVPAIGSVISAQGAVDAAASSVADLVTPTVAAAPGATSAHSSDQAPAQVTNQTHPQATNQAPNQAPAASTATAPT